MCLSRVAWLAVAGCCLCAPSAGAAPLDAIRKRLADGAPVKIVTFGDSITGIYYHTGSQRAWCDMLGLGLQRAFPEARPQMINAGISGHTTVDALARIEKDVLGHRPDLVVVMFGMNDVTRVPLDQYRDNLRQISRRCLGIGSSVILCTPNSVHENQGRPNSRLAEFSESARHLAAELELPLVDCFAAWQQLRERDELAWMLMMSDEIHPNMNGHRRFAELIGEAIAAKPISLAEVEPTADGLHHTFDRLQSGQSVKLVAMPPYDSLMVDVLKQHFPDAKFEVTVWPVEGKSVEDLSAWAQPIRDLTPDLVVPAVPGSARSADSAAYIRNYEWVLNWSFQFTGRPWDVVPVLPSVTEQLDADSQAWEKIARQILVGKDVLFVDRAPSIDGAPGDERSPRAILAAWVAAAHEQWKK